MREVKPEVYLVGHTDTNAKGIVEYLEAVGGASWFDMRLNDAQNNSPEEHLIEFGGRLCYRSWEPGLNANVKKIREDAQEYFDNLLKSGHGSVLEHSTMSFVFHNVSRVFTHELVRHRAGTAISQESLRFVRLTDIPFWFPAWMDDYPTLKSEGTDLINKMEAFQTRMAQVFRLDDAGVPFGEKKAKTSFMRRFAPEGVATGILWTANIRTIRHCIEMRTADHAEEEIRLVFDRVAALARAEAPKLFGDYERLGTGAWVTSYRKV